ncbi:hypothetical protein BH11ACT1_BH11ACT1_16040 [soil metagenome]
MVSGGGSQTLTVSPAYAPPAYPVCEVYRMVGGTETLQTGKRCTVTDLTAVNVWGTAGTRQANVNIGFSYTGATYPDYVKFTVDMATAGLSTSWSWASSGTRGGNLLVSSTYRCSSLPILTGSSDPGWGPTSGFQFQVVEDRSTSGVTCAP